MIHHTSPERKKFLVVREAQTKIPTCAKSSPRLKNQMVHPLGNLNRSFACRARLVTAQIESAIWLVVRGSGIIIRPYGTMVPILNAAVIVIPGHSYSFLPVTVVSTEMKKKKYGPRPAAQCSFYLINLVKFVRLLNWLSVDHEKVGVTAEYPATSNALFWRVWIRSGEGHPFPRNNLSVIFSWSGYEVARTSPPLGKI